MKQSILSLLTLFLFSLFQLLNCSSTKPDALKATENSTKAIDNCQKPTLQPSSSTDSEYFREARIKMIAVAEEFDRNCRLWKEKNITNYDFEMERFAEGYGGDWTQTFSVREGNPLPLQTKNNFPPSHQYERINTVEKLFDRIQKGFDDDQLVKVTFNKEHGFPADLVVQDPRSTGIESLKIKKFEIVQ